MYKIIPPGSFNFGEEMAGLVKIASSGLRGHDFKVFVKRAGSELAEQVRRMTFRPGEVPIHLLAMGALESTGGNRNADSWKAATLEEDHKTFEKHARFYRDHDSKNPARSYGRVPLSYYNPSMKRIELIVSLNGTKEAAERNGGLVADKELDLLEKGADIPVSMGVNCQFDKCSSCQNKARTRREYCDGPSCPHGGLRKNAGKVFEDGHHLTAVTYGNKWKDISHVGRPADRTAYVFGKVASHDDRIVCGAELAEMLDLAAPLDAEDYDGSFPGGSGALLSRVKTARHLYEQLCAARETSYALRAPVRGIDKLSSAEVPLALKALAEQKIVLTLPEWLQAHTGLDYEKCAATARTVQPHLADEFGRLLDDSEFAGLLRVNTFPTQEPGQVLAKWAMEQRDGRALDDVNFRRGLWLASLRGQPIVSAERTKAAAAPSDAVRALADHYLAYQVEAAHSLSTRVDRETTHRNLLIQLNATGA